MIHMTENTVTEIHHPLSPTQSAAEKAVLTALDAHFSAMTGTMREAYDGMHARVPIAADVGLERVDNDGTRGWWIRPKGAPHHRAILFFHGGAYMLGSAAAYRGLVSQLCARAGVAGFVADYPLAPEHPFPAAFDAAVAARRFLGDQDIEQIAIVGDSAGGALALGVMAAEAGRSEVRSVVAFSPWIDLTLSGGTFNDPHTFDPIFHSPHILTQAAQTYLAGADPSDGRASPLFDIPEVLPPLLIQVGSDEFLLDDARRYAAAAVRRSDSEVRLDIYEGLHHVFQSHVVELEGARHALETAAAFINRHWGEKAA